MVQETQVDRLLVAARETIAEVRYAWLSTVADDGGARQSGARIPGRPE